MRTLDQMESHGAWVDKGLYWAWTGASPAPRRPPTAKAIRYAEVAYPRMKFRLAVSVEENGQTEERHREELKWHVSNGANVSMPDYE